MKILKREASAYSNIIKCAVSILILSISSPSYSIDKNELILSEFKAWSLRLDDRYSYDSIKKYVSNYDEYLFMARLGTHSLSMEVIIVTNKNDISNFLYLSSKQDRAVSCATVDRAISVDFLSNSIIHSVEDVAAEIHSNYTVIEKRKNDSIELFTFSRFSNPLLQDEVNRFNSYLMRSMLKYCSDIKIEQVSSDSSIEKK